MSETSRPKKKGEEVNLKQSGNGWAYDSGRNAGIDEVDKYLSDKVVLKREALSVENLRKILCSLCMVDRHECLYLKGGCDTVNKEVEAIIKYIEENKL